MSLRSQRGFTLIEVLVALSVVMIGAMSLISAIGTTSRTARITTTRDKLAMAIQNQIEEIQAWPNPALGRTFAQLQGKVVAGDFNSDVQGVRCGPSQPQTIVVAPRAGAPATATMLPLRLTANWSEVATSERLVVDYTYVER